MSEKPWRDMLPVPWHSRGLGLDVAPGCFVCGAGRRNPESNEYLNNIAAHLHVNDQFAAMACFARGARMAYYHGDDRAPQIKVGACDKHKYVLEQLSRQWFVSRHRVDELVQFALLHDKHEEQMAQRDREAKEAAGA